MYYRLKSSGGLCPRCFPITLCRAGKGTRKSHANVPRRGSRPREVDQDLGAFLILADIVSKPVIVKTHTTAFAWLKAA